MDRIIITGDILRPNEDNLGSNQDLNIKWFYNLIYWEIKLNTKNTAIDILDWNNFNTEKFYTLLKIPISIKNWAKIYNISKLPPIAIDYLNNYFSRCKLVIGYELPTIFRSYFDNNDIIYVDCAISPIRFLDDIYLDFISNSESLNNVIRKYELDERQLYLYAGLHKATMSRISRDYEIKENSCLIIGQTKYDRSIINKNSFDSLTNYHDRICELSKEFNQLYFKPHPYAPQSKELLEKLQNIDIIVIEENIYTLLTNKNIVKVVGLSSSVLNEAKYFNVESEFLIKNIKSDKISVYNEYLSLNFWNNVLSGIVSISTNPIKCKIFHKENLLRNSLNNYWGYNGLYPKTLSDNLIKKDDDKTNFSFKVISILSRLINYIKKIIR